MNIMNRKQILLRGLAALLCMWLGLTATAYAAYDFMVDGLCYNKNSDGTSVTVTSQNMGSPSYSSLSGSLTIPSSVTYYGKTYSVTTIGGGAFSSCSGLTSVIIPNSVTSISMSAFRLCSGLTSVTIPNSVTFIGEHAFQGCYGLTGSLTIPNSVTSIGEEAFYNCTGLTSVTIGNSVTSIGDNAFYNCKRLTSVHINDIAAWCKISFGINTNLLRYAHHLFLNNSEVTNLVIPNSVTSIGNYAFEGCSGLTSVTIPNSVTEIGNSAFYNCSGLTGSLTIPNSVTTIGGGAFQSCSGLTSVTIGNSVTAIGGYAFNGCSGLTSVTIPNSVTTISNSAFSGCSGLASIIVETGNTKYDSRGNCNAIIETETNTLIAGCKNTIIPNSVTSIGNQAFQGCSGLTSVTIPNSVTAIGDNAFYNCSGLTAINNHINHPTDVQLGSAVFYNIPEETCVLYVPIGSEQEYRNANQWKNFTQIIETDWGETTVCPATGITLSIGSASVLVGGSLQLTATVLPENATNKTVTWLSSDSTVASVNSEGTVTALSVGTATITATTADGTNLSASCLVTVIPILASSVSLDKSSETVMVGDSFQLTATVLPDNTTNKSVTWLSSDSTVATVDSVGNVTGVGVGVATITATTADGTNLSASCEVTVVDRVLNLLEADDFSALTGTRVGLAVSMTNEAAITALQADIFLPEGVSIETEDGDYLVDLTDRQGRDHTASVNRLSNGAFRLLVGSPTSKAFSGNEGDLFIIRLVVADDMEGGDYTIGLSNVILSATDATVFYAPDVAVGLRVFDYIRGDANGDRTVNVGDYVTVGNYILDLNPQPFVFKAADIDENNTINVGDMVGVANIILSYMGAPMMKASEMGIKGNCELTADGQRLDNGHYVVTLNLSNAMSLTALQTDVNLPAGMSVEEAYLSDRASSSHQLAIARLDNGGYRLIAASSASRSFAGHDGAVLTMVVKGQASDGMVTFSDILMAEPNTTCHEQEEFSLPLGTTGIEDVHGEVRIYADGDAVVVESPSDSVMQVIMANGLSTQYKVKAGHNIYRDIRHGIVIVKVADQVAKLRL